MNTLTPEQRERVLDLLRRGRTLRQIEHETGHRRETVAAYGRRAGLIGGDIAVLEAPDIRSGSVCETYRETIASLLDAGVSLREIHAHLQRDGFAASYSALKRYVRESRLRTATAALAA